MRSSDVPTRPEDRALPPHRLPTRLQAVAVLLCLLTLPAIWAAVTLCQSVAWDAHSTVVLAAAWSAAIVGAGAVLLASVRRLERQHKALHISAQQAQSADRAKTEFLATIAQALRTPLTHQIRQSSEPLGSLLTEILDIVELESGSMVLAMEPVDIRSALQSCVAALHEATQRKSLEMLVHVSPLLPVTLHGDALRLRQILSSLLANAVAFTGAGRIDVHAEPAGSRWVLRVAGRGCEMDVSMLQSILETFRHGDATAAGLAQSRLLARHMGGDLCVTSVAGHGTTFSLELPLVRPRTDGMPLPH